MGERRRGMTKKKKNVFHNSYNTAGVFRFVVQPTYVVRKCVFIHLLRSFIFLLRLFLFNATVVIFLFNDTFYNHKCMQRICELRQNTHTFFIPSSCFIFMFCLFPSFVSVILLGNECLSTLRKRIHKIFYELH